MAGTETIAGNDTQRLHRYQFFVAESNAVTNDNDLQDKVCQQLCDLGYPFYDNYDPRKCSLEWHKAIINAAIFCGLFRNRILTDRVAFYGLVQTY
jgi:hypothetical protein